MRIPEGKSAAVLQTRQCEMSTKLDPLELVFGVRLNQKPINPDFMRFSPAWFLLKLWQYLGKFP